MTWIDAVVNARTPATPDIALFDLAPTGGTEFPSYTAGSHVDVDLGSGLVRQYSLCGPPEPDRYRLAVLNVAHSRGGSRAMHALAVGDRVRISAPRNHFPLAATRSHVLIAGGIGITPLLAMLIHLEQTGADYVLHYSARTRSRAAFLDELAANPRVRLHFDDEDPALLLDITRDLGDPRPDTAVYVCGPDGFMDYVVGKAEALGWPRAALHTERFGTNLTTPSDAGRAGFTVRVASTGAEYSVADDQSVLDVLLDNGVDAPFSCRQGICGECVVRVLAGEPDHRDDVLTDTERADGMFTTCSSRSHSPVIEVDL
ncbi:PDR/VanB family oxidoreductase [Nocardia fluminea]|uniref:Vanillate O-demethylase ferredoxin subunit n=1 Tax=Nocardia fluminea TaxID=134984 RepID=A0A2N3V5D8_9NOCA|nr:PDR/VanB family oxidoreductase [Nocardia fluminea]PKV76847.1 vanillate O-demethylase ferredoxin subunit [Nocardia fluminea]